MTKNAPHPWNSERFKIDSFRSGSVCAMKERSSNLKRATACWMRLRPTPSRTSRIRAQTASHFVDKHGPGIRWEFVALTTTPKGWRVLRTLSTSAPAAMQPLSVTRLINSSPFTICHPRTRGSVRRASGFVQIFITLKIPGRAKRRRKLVTSHVLDS
jgi:hypothetical protein